MNDIISSVNANNVDEQIAVVSMTDMIAYIRVVKGLQELVQEQDKRIAELECAMARIHERVPGHAVHMAHDNGAVLYGAQAVADYTGLKVSTINHARDLPRHKHKGTRAHVYYMHEVDEWRCGTDVRLLVEALTE